MKVYDAATVVMLNEADLPPALNSAAMTGFTVGVK